MNQFYGYIRVSTAKQEKGVSLEEQRAAIQRFAERQGLHISEWYEEVLTAAKKGRPLFSRMIQGLKSGKASGVIMHKIDRSARNLRDWLELADLIDSGDIAVHFVNESIDLRSRGGRLSADIQAVIAADYIRNLREETRKGIYGRLRQGVYPFCAPLGYKNSGPGGRLKTIDEARAPFIRQAFELYATGRYTLDTLLAELHRRGLRNGKGRPIWRNTLSLILNNPFYAGLIQIRTTGETFQGAHQPLISMALFKQVQACLTRRLRTEGWIHDFTFRGLFRCSLCGRHLTAERQKGHVYYRCFTRKCPTRCFREEVLEDALLGAWGPVALSEEKRERLIAHLNYLYEQQAQNEGERRAHVDTHIATVKTRLTRLIDAFIDGALDKESFEMRKRALLEEERSLQESLEAEAPRLERTKALIMDWFELACTAQESYRMGSQASKRELAIRLSSNLTVAAKNVSVEPYFPLSVLKTWSHVHRSGHHRNAIRTEKEAARRLWQWAEKEAAKTDEEHEERLLSSSERDRRRRHRLRAAA